MQKKEVNIGSLKKNLNELLDFVINGDEIIITKSDIPIAKISPIEQSKVEFKRNFLTQNSLETHRTPFVEKPEIWFG